MILHEYSLCTWRLGSSKRNFCVEEQSRNLVCSQSTCTFQDGSSVIWGFPDGSAVKNPAGAGDEGSNPGLGRSPGEANGNPLQYSRLGNPMDRGAWRAIVQEVTKSRTQLSMNASVTHGSSRLFCD